MPETALSQIINNFTSQLSNVLDDMVKSRINAALTGVFTPPRRRGRPPKNGLPTLALLGPSKPRRKQLCPVPGCKNPAAPVFGMVCSKHKDVPKKKIKEYREARRKAKAAA